MLIIIVVVIHKRVESFSLLAPRNNTDNVTVPLLLTILTRDKNQPGEELRTGVICELREIQFELVNGDREDDSISIFGIQSHVNI